MRDVREDPRSVNQHPAIEALIAHIEELIADVEVEIEILDFEIDQLQEDKGEHEHRLWNLEDELQILIDQKDDSAA